MWRLRESSLLAGLVAALITVSAFAFFALPPLVVRPADLSEQIPAPPGVRSAPPQRPTATDLVQARNGARTAAVALLAGIGAALAAGFAARTYYLTRAAQMKDQYRAAVALLVSEETSARVGAIYDLEQVSRQAPPYHRQVVEVLGAFLRSRKRAEDDLLAPPDVQAACTVLRRRRRQYDRGLVLDLAEADLRGVTLDGARMGKAILRSARLDGAFVRGADLRGANLMNARASSVRLDGARVPGASFQGTDLRCATLDGADARKACFEDAVLEDTFLRGADLRKSTGLIPQDRGVGGGIVDARTRLPTL